MKELPKTYDPKTTEARLYAEWESKGYFNAEVDKTKKPFCIVMPPPNVTGQLHAGHALDIVLQDILIRAKRMQGYSALWLPGTDHAGIATQIRVEAELRKEGKTRYDLGREAFIDRVWEWKRLYGDRIVEQQKSMGASCDWRRSRFTMDEGCSKAVREVFVNLYEKGLIYKGNRIINWCPKCTTALSDAEVEYEEQNGNFWHIKYPIKGEAGRYVTIATTRPETMLGDTAVAVNPDDERYTDLVGKTLLLPLTDREIPVIADDYVEKDFGTGCVKITPCHDPNDFEVGKRHNLEEILILDGDAKIINGGKYNGLDRYEARKVMVADLEALGLLDHIEPAKHNVGVCYRCGTTVEPITSKQWFVSMKPLTGEAIRTVEDGEVKFVPDRFSKNYIRWMENLRDWCISRQLWWGHRIPAFYCDDCGEMTVSREDITACPKCGGHVHQDEDVLDTWFSSALWPFSTLGWPEKTEELDYYYPTSVLVTGYDIITFWVSRMIFSGMEQMREHPFDTVLVHGLVRDSLGRKMSKSLNNGIDPLEVTAQYGTDAFRFTLITGNSPGNDMRYMNERVEANRNFANKIWNAARFVLMNLTIDDLRLPEKLELEDKWILSKLQTLIRETTQNLESFELGVAAANIYDFIWDSYCDWYIELTKSRLANKDDTEACEGAQRVLAYVLSTTLKLLHPFMPFITEEVWQALPHEGESIMVSPWPEYDAALSFTDEEGEMESIMEAIRSIRNRRAEMNVAPSRKAKLIIATAAPKAYIDGEAFIKRLAYASELEVIAKPLDDTDGMVIVVTGHATLYLPLSDLVDLAAELKRLTKEREKAEADLARVTAKLSNEGFTAKAPANVVEGERARAAKLAELLAKIDDSIKALK